MVNRGRAMGSDQWDVLPLKQQMCVNHSCSITFHTRRPLPTCLSITNVPSCRGWLIPISVMIDLEHLRSRQPVVTIAEYLKLQGLDPDIEKGNGEWDIDHYHTHTPDPLPSDSVPSENDEYPSREIVKPSVSVVKNDEYDPAGVVRVDYLPPDHDSYQFSIDSLNATQQEAYWRIYAGFSRWHSIGIDEARKHLVDAGLEVWRNPELGGENDGLLSDEEGKEESNKNREKDIEEARTILKQYNLGIVHTFLGVYVERFSILNSTLTYFR